MENRGEDRRDFRRPFRKREDGFADDRREKRDFAGKAASRDREMEELMDLDGEIIHLVMKRAQMLSHLERGGRVPAETEKAIRTSWETRAARMGRDSRLSRELFMLLQSIEPLNRPEDGHSYYNLSPNGEPVDIRLAPPADMVPALFWSCASVASGQPLHMEGLAVTGDLVNSVKAFNLLGGQMRWEENGEVTCLAGAGVPQNMDKVIHAGESGLLLWLVLGLCAGQTSHAKITGDSGMRVADLSPLRRFLPQLGVRLTNVIPSQKGLPVRIECSGMLPDRIVLPEDLPGDFCAALVFCSAFWEKGCEFELPEKDPVLLPLVSDILSACGVTVVREGRVLRMEKGTVSLPERVCLPMDPVAASSLLMLPGFNGGQAVLEGSWGKGRIFETARKILSDAGLDISFGSTEVICSGKTSGTTVPSEEDMRDVLAFCPDLLPLCAVIYAAAAFEGQKVALPAMDGESRYTVEHFLSHCGVHEKDGFLEASEDIILGAWIAPSAAWAMAYALCAFLIPKLRISNPSVVNSVFPRFWNVYNTLPRPQLKRREEQDKEKADDRPARRRIVVKGVYGELPPELPSGDDI